MKLFSKCMQWLWEIAINLPLVAINTAGEFNLCGLFVKSVKVFSYYRHNYWFCSSLNEELVHSRTDSKLT